RYVYITRLDHPNEVIYAENVLQYFADTGVRAREIVINKDGAHRKELSQCLQGDATAVLGFNYHLDHACVGDHIFLDLAAKARVPVIHWIVDHPSARWPQFEYASARNSSFLFLSRFSEAYFRRFIMPKCQSACTVGIGPSRHSRVEQWTCSSFLAREIRCILPLNLTRIGGTLEEAERRVCALPARLVRLVREAIEAAQWDLDHPIEKHF